jgi:acyl carrier protein
MDTIERLNKIFCEIFADDNLQITKDTTSDDIKEWDSFTHLNLILAIEQEFNIKIALGETRILKNVGDMIALIEKKISLG